MNTKSTSPKGHEQQHDQRLHAALNKIHILLLKLCDNLESEVERKALRLADVKEKTGDSRSQIYARLNAKYPAFDPSFPKPFYIGASPRWWHHKIDEWLEQQDSNSRTSH